MISGITENMELIWNLQKIYLVIFSPVIFYLPLLYFIVAYFYVVYQMNL